jgi:sensor histidine kinase YesM
VEYDIDEECNILIPCLILQPLVENAVNHGLIPKKEGGCLNISVKHVGNEVIVKIKDNGVGINKKTLSDIIEGKNLGIGLSNTNERLKEHYNTQIEVVSQAGKGTEFTVTIPTGLRKNKK